MEVCKEAVSIALKSRPRVSPSLPLLIRLIEGPLKGEGKYEYTYDEYVQQLSVFRSGSTGC